MILPSAKKNGFSEEAAARLSNAFLTQRTSQLCLKRSPFGTPKDFPLDPLPRRRKGSGGREFLLFPVPPTHRLFGLVRSVKPVLIKLQAVLQGSRLDSPPSSIMQNITIFVIITRFFYGGAMTEQLELIQQKLKTTGQRKVFDYLQSSNQDPQNLPTIRAIRSVVSVSPNDILAAMKIYREYRQSEDRAEAIDLTSNIFDAEVSQMLDNLRLSIAAKLKDQLSVNEEKFQAEMSEVVSREIAAEERIKEAETKTLSLAEQLGLKEAQIALVNARVRNVEESAENEKQRLLLKYERDLSAANDKIKKLEAELSAANQRIKHLESVTGEGV